MNEQRQNTGLFGTTVLILVVVAGVFLLAIVLGYFPLHNPYSGKAPSTTVPSYPPCATPPRTPSPGFCIETNGRVVLIDGHGNVIGR